MADLEKLISIKGCGPILIRLSWNDAGVFNGVDGCPNAAMRLAGGGEHTFAANAGLPQVAIPLLQAISDKHLAVNDPVEGFFLMFIYHCLSACGCIYHLSMRLKLFVFPFLKRNSFRLVEQSSFQGMFQDSSATRICGPWPPT